MLAAIPPDRVRMSDIRIVECTACHGERGYAIVSGYDPRNGALLGDWYVCHYCDGTGEEEIEVFPIRMKDLP